MMAVAAVIGALWGAATAWAFVSSVHRSARAVTGGRTVGATRLVRPAAVAGALTLPVVGGGLALWGALLSFVVTRNVLVTRGATRHAR